MGKHKRKPPVFAGNVARQAQTRYLRTKKPESERVQENREAAGHVICLCFMVALNDRYTQTPQNRTLSLLRRRGSFLPGKSWFCKRLGYMR